MPSGLWVQVPPSAHFMLPQEENKKLVTAYIIGVALGDGNLSNPNGRAIRLRVTCDTKYPKIIRKIQTAIHKILPTNKISTIKKQGRCCDISCYSNRWETILGWRAKDGSKYKQGVRVPRWINLNKQYSIACLRGLIETDGSIYYDRGYLMVNFTTIIAPLAKDFTTIVDHLGFTSKIYKIKTKTKDRYNIRISKNVNKFIKLVKIYKKIKRSVRRGSHKNRPTSRFFRCYFTIFPLPDFPPPPPVPKYIHLPQSHLGQRVLPLPARSPRMADNYHNHRHRADI